MLFCLKAIADEVEGDNVLIVTHGDGVNASVTRIWPWAIAHPVLHTGFTVAMREREDGTACYIYLPSAFMPDTRLHGAGLAGCAVLVLRLHSCSKQLMILSARVSARQSLCIFRVVMHALHSSITSSTQH